MIHQSVSHHYYRFDCLFVIYHLAFFIPSFDTLQPKGGQWWVFNQGFAQLFSSDVSDFAICPYPPFNLSSWFLTDHSNSSNSSLWGNRYTPVLHLTHLILHLRFHFLFCETSSYTSPCFLLLSLFIHQPFRFSLVSVELAVNASFILDDTEISQTVHNTHASLFHSVFCWMTL